MAQSTGHGKTALQGQHAFCKRDHHHHTGDRFGRLFSDLPALFTDPRVLEDIGASEGPMDGGSNPAETTSVAVGHVFFGQFVDHDITLDVASSFDRVNQPDEINNTRTPTLDLDCIYGSGPEATPHLYHADGAFKGIKLVTGAEVGSGSFTNDDLPRAGTVALIGDPRNDENRIVSQIQLNMLRFHNKMCDELSGEYSGGALFEHAREAVTWHYQWCVVHDFLTKICGEGAVNRVLSEGRKCYLPKEPFIPVEFSVAAYRFGHSMVPMKVQAQKNKPRFELFGTKFGKGFSPVTSADAVCDMHELFNTYDNRIVQTAVQLNGKMAEDLLKLPTNIVGGGEASLATRNLIRGQSFLLPSGENIARQLERDQAEIDQVSAAAQTDAPDLKTGTPLWFYLLKEAEVIGREAADGTFEPGEGLGPVGAQIVAEVVIGLIELDPRSWLGSNRNWRPMTASDNGTDYEVSSVGNMLVFHAS